MMDITEQDTLYLMEGEKEVGIFASLLLTTSNGEILQHRLRSRIDAPLRVIGRHLVSGFMFYEPHPAAKHMAENLLDLHIEQSFAQLPEGADIDNLEYPLECKVHVNRMIMNNPDLFHVLKKHLSGTTLVLTEEILMELTLAL